MKSFKEYEEKISYSSLKSSFVFEPRNNTKNNDAKSIIVKIYTYEVYETCSSSILT